MANIRPVLGAESPWLKRFLKGSIPKISNEGQLLG